MSLGSTVGVAVGSFLAGWIANHRAQKKRDRRMQDLEKEVAPESEG